MKKFIFGISLLFFLLFPAKITAADTYTKEEVAQHDASASCWTISENKVYDLTEYLDQHDVYLDIRQWCGKDMTGDFKDKAGLGRDHKSSSYYLFESYYIGELSSTDTTASTQTVTSEQDSSAEEQYSVEISGQELKTLTIGEISDLWSIDTDDLLQQIINEFDLKKMYTANSLLYELRAEYKFSPSQIKDIAESLKTKNLEVNNLSNSNADIQSNERNPYNLPIPFSISLFLYLLTWHMSKSSLGKKFKLLAPSTFNMFWNTVLLLSLIPSALFGFYMILRFSIPELYNIRFNFLWWHVEGSIIFGTISILHFITRLNLYIIPLKFPRKG
ncbi:MAG: cytochrome b5 domain-containing protein [Candidatus Dojkabacteria bacterium]|nr:cytochrome b5 domain-containing protein [Candidatus Dojkabacteria bacterium]